MRWASTHDHATSLHNVVFCRVSSVIKGQNVGIGLQPKTEARAMPRLSDRIVAGVPIVPIIVSWSCMSWPPCPGQSPAWPALAFKSKRMMTCIHENCRAAAYERALLLHPSLIGICVRAMDLERQGGNAHAVNTRFTSAPHLCVTRARRRTLPCTM